MASPTDLDGFLRTDDGNLSLRFGSWFSELGTGKKVGINLRFRNANATSWEKIAETITVDVNNAGIINLISIIEQKVTERLGPTPYGTLRVSAYEVGHSNSPALDLQRTLIPSESGGIGEPNVNLLRSLLASATAQNVKLIELLVQLSIGSAQLNGQLAQALSHAATTRTASAAGAELGGLGTLATLGAFILFAPSIKAALGFHPNDSIETVIAGLRAKVATMGELPKELKTQLKIQESDAPVTLEARPPGVTDAPLLDDKQGTTEITPDQIIKTLKDNQNNPDYMLSFMKELGGLTPDQKAALKSLL